MRLLLKYIFIVIELVVVFPLFLPIRPRYTLSLPPENIRKPYGLLMLSRGRERVHWKPWLKFHDPTITAP